MYCSASNFSIFTAVDLSSSVNGELIRRITSSPATVKKLAPLLPQFGGPEVREGSLSSSSEEVCKSEVEETLLSPQFQHALSAFCAAFPTGQLGPLISQFGMGTEAVNAAQAGNLEAFLNAIQKEASTTGAPQQGAGTKAPASDEVLRRTFLISCFHLLIAEMTHLLHLFSG